ncbi:AAA family ATPase [Mucilaginibacter sp. NFX135]|uniref:AAA family ATPase n=1 Tax=Mucilaginibacter sp. NFX135 TaxID=3402687 RepID=UPI003AFB65B0
MKINFTGKYKSLTSFESDDLSNFTVITGKNGTGKSQLVYCINESLKPVSNQNTEFKLSFNPHLTTVQVSDLLYKSNGPATIDIFKKKIGPYYTSFENIKKERKKLYNTLIESDVSLADFINFEQSQIIELLRIPDLKNFMENLLSENPPVAIRFIPSKPENNLTELFKNSLKADITLFNILSQIKGHKKKHIDDLERDDFFTTPILEKYIDSSDMFESQVETIFFNYLKRRYDNDRLSYRNERFGETNAVLNESEFETKFPAPWDLVNTILRENDIPLKVKTYKIEDYSESIRIELNFQKEGVNEIVLFDDLSSGEKVIIGLVLKLFTQKYYETDLKFPELIVLDEPDAYLHPEMSKLLIDVLYKSFVNKLGIRVIMTTHSPSTVALAPEDCIYEMANTPSCSLKQISKDSALEILTGKIPTLSIDYRNHKQILLESPTDVTYFQKLFNKVNAEEKLTFKLYFISNEMGKGNCDWVKSTVLKLREGGVNSAYGIIDWDGKNSSSNEVFVHGEKRRYSVENFLYDAIYLSVLFLESNGANNIRSELNFDDTYNQYNLSNESNERLQEVWNWYIKKIEDVFPALKSDQYIDIFYYNQKRVSIPKWFVNMQGHDELETKLRKVFPSLSKYTSEGYLQDTLSVIAAKCYPLIPLESIELLKQLCL